MTPIGKTDDDRCLVREVEQALSGSETSSAALREESLQGTPNGSPYLQGMATPSVSTRALILLRRSWRPGAIALSLVGSSALCAMGGGLPWIWKIEIALQALVGLWLAVAAGLHTVRIMTLDRELKKGFDGASKALLDTLRSAPRTTKSEHVTAQTIANLERLQALREKVGTRGS